ncbi:MAG: AbrB/MazE/SpoVT family DNA-binding domain-containing protein [Phycisphaeraceae bacterium]
MVSHARLEHSGHIHLSPEACERLGWREGDSLLVEETERGLLIRRASTEADEAALGKVGEALACETWSPEDFSEWESSRG